MGSFNPRTRVGCDASGGGLFPFIWSFNPRTRVGCDPPAWSAECPHSKFQSTHPRGVRLHKAAKSLEIDVFQSTHPRGVRRGAWWRFDLQNLGFNPRTRVGCDHEDSFRALAASVSIHAPAWGATAGTYLAVGTSCVSIHAPAWGATPGRHAPRPRTQVSIHAPAWGAT